MKPQRPNFEEAITEFYARAVIGRTVLMYQASYYLWASRRYYEFLSTFGPNQSCSHSVHLDAEATHLFENRASVCTLSRPLRLSEVSVAVAVRDTHRRVMSRCAGAAARCYRRTSAGGSHPSLPHSRGPLSRSLHNVSHHCRYGTTFFVTTIEFLLFRDEPLEQNIACPV